MDGFSSIKRIQDSNWFGKSQRPGTTRRTVSFLMEFTKVGGELLFECMNRESDGKRFSIILGKVRTSNSLERVI